MQVCNLLACMYVRMCVHIFQVVQEVYTLEPIINM